MGFIFVLVDGGKCLRGWLRRHQRAKWTALNSTPAPSTSASTSTSATPTSTTASVHRWSSPIQDRPCGHGREPQRDHSHHRQCKRQQLWKAFKVGASGWLDLHSTAIRKKPGHRAEARTTLFSWARRTTASMRWMPKTQPRSYGSAVSLILRTELLLPMAVLGDAPA